LFLVTDELPATLPVALALIVSEAVTGATRTRALVRIASRVITTALPTHQMQIASIVKISRYVK
jgi:hypothetical protein